MTAQAAPEDRVYYCLVCGPCIQEIGQTPWGQEVAITLHRDIPHPPDMTFDEEEHPQ